MKKFLLLPFFIICIGIFVSSSSIVKAYTYNDLYEFCYNNQGNGNTIQNNTMTRFVQIANDMKTSLTNAGINLDAYNTFYIKVQYSSSNYIVHLILVENAQSFSTWNSGSRISFNNTQSYKYLYMQATSNQVSTFSWNSGNNKSGTGTYQDNNCGIYDSVGLLENASTNFLSYSGLFAQNYYNAITSNDITITQNSTIPFILQQGLVGLSYNVENISYKLYSQNDDYITDLTAVYSNVNSGKAMNLLLETLNLINTGYYKIKMYNNTDLIYTSDIFKITKSRTPQAGDITNSSGDVTGKVDLSATNQKLDNINNSIISGDNKIIASIKDLESGEKTRNDFWKKTYDDLFTMSSGDVQDIYNGIKNSFNSGDFVFEYYKPITEVFDRDPTDFVIHWDPISLHLTAFNGDPFVSGEVIPSGDINFSKICRDNSTLGNIKIILNSILGFSFLFLLIFEYYRILLYCLGVGSELVGEATSYESQTVEIDSEIAHVTTHADGRKTATITKSFGTSTRRRR